MPKKKYPKLSPAEYNEAYMKVYYYLNRERLLERAKRPINCPKCKKTMPRSSLSYHLRHCHSTIKPRKIRNNLTRENGKFTLNFD